MGNLLSDGLNCEGATPHHLPTQRVKISPHIIDSQNFENHNDSPSCLTVDAVLEKANTLGVAVLLQDGFDIREVIPKGGVEAQPRKEEEGLTILLSLI